VVVPQVIFGVVDLNDVVVILECFDKLTCVLAGYVKVVVEVAACFGVTLPYAAYSVD
jgi:hypothetical protein